MLEYMPIAHFTTWDPYYFMKSFQFHSIGPYSMLTMAFTVDVTYYCILFSFLASNPTLGSMRFNVAPLPLFEEELPEDDVVTTTTLTPAYIF